MTRRAGRVAIVTGAAQGIGRGIASAFAREGADPALSDVPRSRHCSKEAFEERGWRAAFGDE